MDIKVIGSSLEQRTHVAIVAARDDEDEEEEEEKDDGSLIGT